MPGVTVDVDGVLRPHFEALMAAAGRPALFDAHTHIGRNDPDGYKQEPEELLAALGAIGARGLVFPMHEPGGYPEANDRVVEVARASGGRLAALCRVDPRRADSVHEARRCLDAGAAGIKLHPRAERFTLHEPRVSELVALVHERRAPMLIHAGRGIPALGEDTVRLSEEFRDARLILAHCAISDLAWLWQLLPEHPNVYIDTSWWHPSDILAVLELAPSGQVLWASDSPYGTPLNAATTLLRYGLHIGLGPDQLAGIMGGQLERLVAGAEPLDLGPPPGARPGVHPLLERVVANLTAALGRAFGGADATEPVALARLACDVPPGVAHEELFTTLKTLFAAYEATDAPPPPGRGFPDALRLLVAALCFAATPQAPLPEPA